MSKETDTTAVEQDRPSSLEVIPVEQHIVEIISDSGEGAQKAGQSFGTLSARMGNGVWTVEIIPADIQPPPRTRESASGIRVRLGRGEITNAGATADVVVAFNEVAPYVRIEQEAYCEGTLFLMESKWGTDGSSAVRENYQQALNDFRERGYRVMEIPMEEEMKKAAPGAKKGKNMWVLGMLSFLYRRDLQIAEEQIRNIFSKKSQAVIDTNVTLLHAGHAWAVEHLNFQYELTPQLGERELVVMNGNEALSFGIMAAGIEVCSMYPITPATSVTHHLAESFRKVGGVVHQAEDELAAIGFATGATYAGKPAVTITSGPGLALKTEFIGLTSMAEVPVIIIDVQRGGPSTGMPTKVEQSDLLAALYGQPGDTPKVVLAPSTIEECFQFVVMARKIAESFRTPVIILSDANLGTGVQPFPRPQLKSEWLASPIDQSAWAEHVPPFDWDKETGLSRRPIPGQRGGEYTLTGLAHNTEGKVSYNAFINQRATAMRSKKMAALGRSLKPPTVHGAEEGKLLLVGWGSTRGAIEEAVDLARADGLAVSSVHLRFLSPMEPGLKEIFQRFDKVMTVEINYSDDPEDPIITPENRRYAQLAWILRARTLVDVDCFSNVYGQPMRPDKICQRIQKEIK